MKLNRKESELKLFLDQKVEQYGRWDFFIETDPIQIPKQFSKKEDIEIMAFLIATIAWGQRKSIIANGKKLIDLFSNEPYQFITQHSDQDLRPLTQFVHRTFNGEDLLFFVYALKQIYLNHGGLEAAFSKGSDIEVKISNFRSIFLQYPHLKRSEKHLANPRSGSSAKRLNMFLRWMVRPSSPGCDFALWTQIDPAELLLPLDVHSGRVARKLKLLNRPQDDWKAVLELSLNMRRFDPLDPCKYDYALFGLGAFESF